MPIVEAGFIDDATATGPQWLLGVGPTIQVIVGLHPAAPMGGAEGTGPASRETFALIDTGATLTCIDDALAQELGLPVIDRQTCSGIGGSHDLDVYAAQIIAPGLGGLSQFGRFAGVKLADGGQAHKVLIGRSFLQSLIMVYDGRTGRVQLAV
jgi:predicted aspartyl protease